jgi:hypothetical protein
MPGNEVAQSPYSITVLGPESTVPLDIENTLPGDNTNSEHLSPRASFPWSNSQRSNSSSTSRTTAQTDNANWAYTKVAGLFFIALMVTWIPSSANRIYSFIHVGEISLGLEYISAFVLPLQGFWNAIIYASTSLSACQAFWKQLSGHKIFHGNPLRRTSGSFALNNEGEHGQPARLPECLPG